MATARAREPRSLEPAEPLPAAAWIPLIGVAAVVTLAHLATNGRYGFHRDELQFLSDARHLDWGFVAYPPLTPFVEHVSMSLFGLSMVGLRLASVVAQAIALVAVGLMAREFGGGRLAQFTATLAVALSPVPLFNGTEFQYTSFDFLWWVLIAYFVARFLRTENPRWWLGIGGIIGLGLLTKYAIVFYIAGVLAGLALTPARRVFLSRWFWAGVALALVLFLPNLVWLARHDFISYHFLQHIHVRDVGEGRTEHFWRDQVWICISPAAAPLALWGLVGLLRSSRFRAMAFLYLIPLGIFFAAKGRGYYMTGAYPMLLAMGAAAAGSWMGARPAILRRGLPAVFYAGLAFCGAYIAAIVLPLASDGPLRAFALEHNGDLREEFGWQELVSTVAGIRDTLPAEQQANLGLVVGNYGEAGAIEILGPALRLPAPISMTNSAWLRGYPATPPTTLILVGFSREWAERNFTGCRLAGHNGNALGIHNEESDDHPDIFVCGPPRLSWAEFWKTHQFFG
ncbi:MAG: glycosyltransferase family 39 protein [Terracidiphilus sp.]